MRLLSSGEEMSKGDSQKRNWGWMTHLCKDAQPHRRPGKHKAHNNEVVLLPMGVGKRSRLDKTKGCSGCGAHRTTPMLLVEVNTGSATHGR